MYDTPQATPATQAARPASPERAHARLRPQREPGGALLRRPGPLSRCAALGQPGLDPAPHDPRPPNRARARRIPPRLAEGSAREGVREPEAGPRRWRPPGREAAGRVDAHLRGRDPAGLEPAAAGLALPSACAALAEQPGALRHPPHRGDADIGSDERRRDRDSRSDLARRATHRPEVAPAHPRGHGVGRGDGPSARQPVRPDRPGARSAGGACSAHAGVAARRGGVRDRDGGGVERADGREAGVRVSGADGGTLRRGPGGRSGRRSTGRRACGPSRPRARRGIASTGCRCAGVLCRSSRRRGRSIAAALSCFRACAESHSGARRWRNCSGS